MDGAKRQPAIVEDRTNGVVFVDGLRVWGFLAPTYRVTCGHTAIYAERYDAYFCPVDDTWLGTKCDADAACDFCDGRPAKPLSGPLDEPVTSFSELGQTQAPNLPDKASAAPAESSPGTGGASRSSSNRESP
jgi:hypothetical protein